MLTQIPRLLLQHRKLLIAATHLTPQQITHFFVLRYRIRPEHHLVRIRSQITNFAAGNSTLQHFDSRNRIRDFAHIPIHQAGSIILHELDATSFRPKRLLKLFLNIVNRRSPKLQRFAVNLNLRPRNNLSRLCGRSTVSEITHQRISIRLICTQPLSSFFRESVRHVSLTEITDIYIVSLGKKMKFVFESNKLFRLSRQVAHNTATGVSRSVLNDTSDAFQSFIRPPQKHFLRFTTVNVSIAVRRRTVTVRVLQIPCRKLGRPSVNRPTSLRRTFRRSLTDTTRVTDLTCTPKRVVTHQSKRLLRLPTQRCRQRNLERTLTDTEIDSSILNVQLFPNRFRLESWPIPRH